MLIKCYTTNELLKAMDQYFSYTLEFNILLYDARYPAKAKIIIDWISDQYGPSAVNFNYAGDYCLLDTAMNWGNSWRMYKFKTAEQAAMAKLKYL